MQRAHLHVPRRTRRRSRPRLRREGRLVSGKRREQPPTSASRRGRKRHGAAVTIGALTEIQGVEVCEQLRSQRALAHLQARPLGSAHASWGGVGWGGRCAYLLARGHRHMRRPLALHVWRVFLRRPGLEEGLVRCRGRASDLRHPEPKTRNMTRTCKKQKIVWGRWSFRERVQASSVLKGGSTRRRPSAGHTAGPPQG